MVVGGVESDKIQADAVQRTKWWVRPGPAERGVGLWCGWRSKEGLWLVL
jgi:hypothetical protein